MIKPPEHPVGPDFDKARDWIAQQESQLTEKQQQDYDKLKQKQEKQRKEQQQKLDSYRRELEEKARQRKAITELVYHPPVKSADSNVKRLVTKALAAEKDLSNLEHVQKNARITALKTYEQQRNQDKQKTSKDFKESWKNAVEKVARQESTRNRERGLSRDFNKSR